MDSPQENSQYPPSSLRAEFEQLCPKYESLLEKHQALLKQFESPKEMTVGVIKLSLINNFMDFEKKKRVERLCQLPNGRPLL
jgi:hypothetical protein